MLYVVAVLGFALNLHYGDNQIQPVKVSSSFADDGKSKTADKIKCCKYSRLQIKAKDTHPADETSLLSRFFGFELPSLPFGSQSYTPQPTSVEKYFDREPSDKPVQNIVTFIKNCIFRL